MSSKISLLNLKNIYFYSVWVPSKLVLYSQIFKILCYSLILIKLSFYDHYYNNNYVVQ